MAEIRRLGFDALVREVSQDRPFLGICVGMQALLDTAKRTTASTASACSRAR
jgi:glutamine amidotransferase